MARGGSRGMLGVGGTRSNLSRASLRGAGGGGRGANGGTDPNAQKRELLRALKAQRNGDTSR